MSSLTLTALPSSGRWRPLAALPDDGPLGVDSDAAPLVAAPFAPAPFAPAPFVEAPLVPAPLVAAPFVAAPFVAAPLVPAPFVGAEVRTTGSGLDAGGVSPGVRRSDNQLSIGRSAGAGVAGRCGERSEAGLPPVPSLQPCTWGWGPVLRSGPAAHWPAGRYCVDGVSHRVRMSWALAP